MADSFDNNLYDANDAKGIDPEIAGLLMIEKQKAQLNAQVNFMHTSIMNFICT